MERGDAKFTDDQLLPLSALQHWLFCPRQCSLIHLEQVWAENKFNAEGQVLHHKAHEGPDESKAGVRIPRTLPVRSFQLGISGQCDIVEFHKTGQVLPVEYKRGKPKSHRADVSTITPAGRSRLRRTAKACLDYGQRVQNSVFECKVDPAQLVTFKARLLDIIDPPADSLRFYHLGSNWHHKVEHHGAKCRLRCRRNPCRLSSTRSLSLVDLAARQSQREPQAVSLSREGSR